MYNKIGYRQGMCISLYAKVTDQLSEPDLTGRQFSGKYREKRQQNISSAG